MRIILRRTVALSRENEGRTSKTRVHLKFFESPDAALSHE